jgi:hypothetical protein
MLWKRWGRVALRLGMLCDGWGGGAVLCLGMLWLNGNDLGLGILWVNGTDLEGENALEGVLRSENKTLAKCFIFLLLFLNP